MENDRVFIEKNKEHFNKKFGKRYNLEGIRLKILNLLEKYENGLNINQISSQLDINRNTISKYLKTLEASNTVKSRKVGVSTLWYRSSPKQRRSGPNILLVKQHNDNRIEIINSNKIYCETISKIPESLIGHSIWNFYPFSQFKPDLEPFFLSAFQQLTDKNDMVSHKFEFKQNEEEVVLVFNLRYQSQEKSLFSIEYNDITLQAELEKDLLNPESFEILMNTIYDVYISVQTETFKVIKANQKTLDEFNNGFPLKDNIFCYDLYHKRDKPCPDCPAIEAMEKGENIERDISQVDKGVYKYQVFPIKSKTGISGYILKINEET
jgi:DNA-binding Lrp family transcriptional regulator